MNSYLFSPDNVTHIYIDMETKRVNLATIHLATITQHTVSEVGVALDVQNEGANLLQQLLPHREEVREMGVDMPLGNTHQTFLTDEATEFRRRNNILPCPQTQLH